MLAELVILICMKFKPYLSVQLDLIDPMIRNLFPSSLLDSFIKLDFSCLFD